VDDELDTDRHIYSVRELNEEISAAVAAAFPRTVWVKGEVQRLPADAVRRTHVYFELHETGATGAAEYQIPVGLMGWDRKKFDLGRFLDGTDPDLQLANQLEVCFETQVDFYAKFGKLTLKIVGVDKDFALGNQLPGIIVHGALKSAWIGQLLGDWVGDEGKIKTYGISYRGMDVPGDTLTCKGNVTKKYTEGDEHLVDCEIWLENSKGEKTTPGTATLVLPTKG